MKNMKLGLVGVLAIAASLFLTSCNPCKDVVCNNGDCVEGDCVCNAGYESDDCSAAVNAKFSGRYTLTETCTTTGNDSYAVNLSPDATSPSAALIDSLYREAFTLRLAINDDGLAFTIATTDIGSGSIRTTSAGTSNADGSTINIDYEFISETSAPSESCAAVLER
jgi:hypothetical protein